jgi:hypothetical protein
MDALKQGGQKMEELMKGSTADQQIQDLKLCIDALNTRF